MQRCFDAAGDRITIMPGAGISADNVDRLLFKLPVREVHASCSAPVAASTPPVLAFGFDTGTRRQTSVARVAALKAALDAK